MKQTNEEKLKLSKSKLLNLLSVFVPPFLKNIKTPIEISNNTKRKNKNINENLNNKLSIKENKNKRTYFPRGVIKSVAKELGITTQAVYFRLKNLDEDTFKKLEKAINDYFRKKIEKEKAIQLRKQQIHNQIRRFNGLP